MSMVLAVRYDDEELCSPESLKGWFEGNDCVVKESKIVCGPDSFDWSHMKLVNTVMFVVDALEDDDFPPILFDYIIALSNDKTIVSLAEENPDKHGFHLIFEAELKRFIKELLNQD